MDIYSLNLITIVLLSCAISFLAMPVIMKVASVKGIYDEPDERKKHSTSTPNLGGVGLFAGVVLVFSVFNEYHELHDVKYMVSSLIIIFFTGIVDDILVLTPRKKLLAQFLAAFLVVYLGQIQITSFYGLFGIQEIPYAVSIVFSIMAILAIINCFNLVDGADGLAGTLGIVSALGFGIWFYLVEEWTMAFLSFALIGSLIGFLRFNWQPAKIFMGDTGAMLIGFILAVLAIHFIEFNKSNIFNEYWVYASPSVAMAIMGIPIFDMIKVFILRLWQRKSPFYPDRNHLHHVLIDLGFSHSKTALTLGLWNLLIILFAFKFSDMKSSYMLACLIVLIFAPSVLLLVYRNSKFQKTRPH